MNKELNEAYKPYSTKPPRKGTLAYEIQQNRKKKDKEFKDYTIKDNMSGVGKLTKEDVSNLIQSIFEGEADQVNSLFDKVMISKLEEAIENKKQEISNSLLDENFSLYAPKDINKPHIQNLVGKFKDIDHAKSEAKSHIDKLDDNNKHYVSITGKGRKHWVKDGSWVSVKD